MNAQQLKNAILQEAIQGRLVPQDPNDEPASALLDRIRKEKARLVKEGKLKKKDLIETPVEEDEKPFEIPESWEWVRLGNVISLLSGRDLSPQDYNNSENGMPYITGASNFLNGGLLINRWTPKAITISKKGDLLITCKGTIGTMAYNLIGDIHIARQVMAINTYLINLDYIKYFLTRQVYELEKKAKSIIPGISREDVLESFFPLPPLAEQQRIVAKIEELLPKVEEYGKAQGALDKLNEELPERLKKSILQEAIEGRLVPQDPNDEPASVLLDKIRKEKAKLVKEGKLKKKDLEETPISEDEIPFKIPESWEWVRVGAIFNHSSGKQLSGSNTDGALHEYITTSNLYWGRFELENLKSMYYKDSELEKCTAKQGDLLVCEGGDIGRCAIWPYDYDICLQNHIHRLRPFDNSYTVFVFYIMWYYKSIGLIGGKGIGIQGLSASALKSIVVPLPPLAEQHRIVEKIEQLMKEINKLKV